MKDNNAFNEMMVHLPLCTHKEASNVLIIGTADADMKDQAAKHSKVSNIEFGDTSLLTSKNEKNIDVIILTDVKINELLLANIERILKDDGLIAFASKAFSRDEDQLFADLKLAGTKFWIAMPFKFGHNTSIIASKRYHPTADINLQRADLLDGLDYYSADIQLASFVFPAAEHRALTGIAKR
ncbi:spermidine synthase [Arcobacter venerupis]|uniref:Spermidine synthase n=1 Tax=Arcobacter venerupis TaxID=1054033 RepID=A0AAE7B6Z1_9BACT|nr:spermidine synthase [Arcobacter venerupis]QKF65751.1 spermidine synthase [Arcobacter venerupis]RWS50261.1 spermidine synthase [Arcobacter venerupis]